MTIHENDVRRSARELRSLLLGLGGTHEPALVESPQRMATAPDPILAARLARAEAELDSTKSELADSVLREATLREGGSHRPAPPSPLDVTIRIGDKRITVHPGAVIELSNVTPEQIVVRNPRP